MSHRAEQVMIYKELLAALKDHGHAASGPEKVGIVAAMHNYSQNDYRELFRTLQATASSPWGMRVIESLHDLLVSYGATSTELLINDETLHMASNIARAYGHYTIPPINNGIREDVHWFINHAITSEDRELVARIISERMPQSPDDLEELHLLSRGIQTSISEGML